jgi:hypothetical protein
LRSGIDSGRGGSAMLRPLSVRQSMPPHEAACPSSKMAKNAEPGKRFRPRLVKEPPDDASSITISAAIRIA